MTSTPPRIFGKIDSSRHCNHEAEVISLWQSEDFFFPMKTQAVPSTSSPSQDPMRATIIRPPLPEGSLSLAFDVPTFQLRYVVMLLFSHVALV